MGKFVLMDVDIEYLLDGEVLLLLEYVDGRCVLISCVLDVRDKNR